jgi:hypothetical protein
MMAIASGTPWYTTGNFWTGVGSSAAILAIIISIIIWRIGAPRGVLEYSITSTIQMIATGKNRLAIPSIEVQYRGSVVTDPYVVALRILNRSRTDIRSSDFDQQLPVRIKFGVPVLEVINSPELESLPVTAQGSEVTIGPVLIRSQQEIALEVLVDGKPEVACDSPIANIDIRLYDERMPAPAYILWDFWLMVGISISCCIGSISEGVRGRDALSSYLFGAAILALVTGFGVAYLAYRRHEIGWSTSMWPRLKKPSAQH